VIRTTWSSPRPSVRVLHGRDHRSLPRAALRRITAVHTVDIVRRETAQQPPAVRTGAEFVLHRATSAEDPLLLRAPVGARRFRRVPAAVVRGDVAYVATVDVQVVGWIWVSRVSHRDQWSGLRFSLTPAECYAYDLWSLPQYRTLGVGAFLLAGLLQDLAEDPTLQWVYGYVDRANTRNQLLLRMVFGFRTVQAVKHICMLDSRGWQIPFTDRPPGGPCSRGR
jgi:ribosomal protein S18 acetylase RimI-like enzyme